MNKFSEMMNGMSADERRALMDDASEFLQKCDEYDTCVFCKKNLTDLVCDASIGIPWRGRVVHTSPTETVRAISAIGAIYTCDLPVCKECRTNGSPIFFCGEESEIVVHDFCPLHTGRDFMVPRGKDGVVVVLPDEVREWRSKTMMLLQNGSSLKDIPIFPEVRATDISRAWEASREAKGETV